MRYSPAILANFGFVIDLGKCIGCHACTIACKAEHDIPIGVNRCWVDDSAEHCEVVIAHAVERLAEDR